MSLFRGPRRKVAIVVTSLIAAATVSAGAAYAYITLTATGSASAAAAEVNQPTVANLTIAPMLPGTTRALSFSLTNPNNFPVKVMSIQRTAPATVTGGGNCSPAQLTGPLSLAAAMAMPGEPSVAAGATVDFTVPDALGLAETADAACDAVFPVKVTVQQQGN